jgi:hypothetical protein
MLRRNFTRGGVLTPPGGLTRTGGTIERRPRRHSWCRPGPFTPECLRCAVAVRNWGADGSYDEAAHDDVPFTPWKRQSQGGRGDGAAGAHLQPEQETARPSRRPQSRRPSAACVDADRAHTRRMRRAWRHPESWESRLRRCRRSRTSSSSPSARSRRSWSSRLTFLSSGRWRRMDKRWWRDELRSSSTRRRQQRLLALVITGEVDVIAHISAKLNEQVLIPAMNAAPLCGFQ